ncbi:MAG: demethoxyubiquinone hydroxylase family protein, partial [Gammaproteobacteria bacterium]
MNQRHFSFFDRLIIQADQVARTLVGKPLVTERSNPSQEQPEAALSQTEHALSAKLMRINHAGEVAAQALYQGQALTARLETVRDQMATAASEENDHLAWCEHRVKELNDHVSYANPLWYAGSFTLGAIAGLAGDKWSLGFVA